jgi:hypothetical protein
MVKFGRKGGRGGPPAPPPSKSATAYGNSIHTRNGSSHEEIVVIAVEVSIIFEMLKYMNTGNRFTIFFLFS